MVEWSDHRGECRVECDRRGGSEKCDGAEYGGGKDDVWWRVAAVRLSHPLCSPCAKVLVKSETTPKTQLPLQFYNKEPGSRYSTHIRATRGLYKLKINCAEGRRGTGRN